MTRKSSRRDFLRGKAAADAMADAISQALPDGGLHGEAEPAAGGSYVIEVSRRAMACQFAVHLNAGQYEQGTEVALEALDLVDVDGIGAIFHLGLCVQ